MTQETRQPEYPYVVTIETDNGRSTSVPIAFLTSKEIENFLQTDFKQMVAQAGLKGVRVHLERAPVADYEKVLGDVAAYLRTAARQAA